MKTKDDEALKRAMEEARRSAKAIPEDKKEMLSLVLRMFGENYEKDQDPCALLKSFVIASQAGLSIPEWVSRKLAQVFQDFLRRPQGSLDAMLGFKKGRGKSPVLTERARVRRDQFLALTMDTLVQAGMKVRDAAKVAHSYFRFRSLVKPNGVFRLRLIEPLPNPEKVRQLYYTFKPWLDLSKRLSSSDRYSKIRDIILRGSLQEILEQSPTEIRNKYPALFSPPSQDSVP
ncbi:MAG: hypothetical protein ABSH25_10400 [Syntrophorhabdales bacterium]|jgi:hypothetical protein